MTAVGYTAPLKHTPRSAWRRTATALTVLLVVGGAIRIGLVFQQGLWVDELFSLAMATGHSVEHPADQADPAQGDYVEIPDPMPPSTYSRFFDHDNPAAPPQRVLRAVFLSETSPPLYFLLLYGWTWLLGTGDAALRLFSVLWALGCLPAVWSLARRLGGRAAQWPAGILFTFSPVCVYYSTEGRMYSLVWFWAVWTVWLTVDLRRRGFRRWTFLLWVAAGALGLLTHYFFAFVWAAAVAWLMLTPGRFARWQLVVSVLLVGLIILPWYRLLPESISHWRVTSNWLYIEPADGFDRLVAFLGLLWSYFSVVGYWGGRPIVDGINAAVFLTLACLVLGKVSGSLWSRQRLLLWAWAVSACLGVALFDLWRGTYASLVPRYALAGLPGALLLCAFGLGRLERGPRVAFLTLIVLLSLVAIRRMYRNDSRQYSPLDDVGAILTRRAGPSDVVIVHSVPVGVAGVARYMDRQGASEKGIMVASWVGQLRQRRVPDDVRRFADGRRQVVVVTVHNVGEPAPEETWLEDHAKLKARHYRQGATLSYFVPKSGPTFSFGPPQGSRDRDLD
jgi:hypothetical protein